MLLGTFGAINQNRIKRLFAYSSIAHVGYLLIALSTGTIEAAESLLLYLIIYMLMNISIFGVILSLRNDPTLVLSRLENSSPYIWKISRSENRPKPLNCLTIIKKKDSGVKYMTDFSSLSRTNPVLALTMAAILFSNAGIPPLAGFYGKLNVFLAAIDSSMYFLALSGIICTTIGAFYSIRLVKIIYFHAMPATQGVPKK